MKQTWPAAERNKEPILLVLDRCFPREAFVLEIASGTGQHAAFFAARRQEWTWQPSDLDPDNLASIAAWVQESRLPNLRPPLALDVCSDTWDLGSQGTVDAIFCANMIHIAPWACTLGLIQGAARYLTPRGRFALYGPFMIGGEHTAQSNADFDASLKARNPEWGVRDSALVIALAAEAGLRLVEGVAMPANNQTLIFERE